MTIDPQPLGTVIQATFDGAVFRPVGSVPLPANTVVNLTVELADAPTPPAQSFLDVAESMRLDGPVDWASNLKDYLYGDRRGFAQ